MGSDTITKVSILGKQSIHAGFHLKNHIAFTVSSTLPSSTYVLITDTNVAPLHLPAFKTAFDKHLPKTSRFLTFIIPPGETSKSREGKASIEDFLLKSACTRDTVIMALGGGVIGDLVGFVAATFMRGVRFVQIPTTLLAMVDSSVGGKTAIDTPHGKNLIGAFWQPEYIFIDASFLSTLPPREFSNGMAEVVKTAAIWDEEEFARLEGKSADIWAAIQTPSKAPEEGEERERTEAEETLLKTIVGSISVKAYIVTKDERETGLRNLVNFGHTIGHAIEAVLTPTILHGECVAIGIILEAEIARQMGVLSQVALGRLSRALKAYNLPVSLADPRIARLDAAKGLTVEKLMDVMKVDKKNTGTQKKIVILSRIGKTYEEKASSINDDIIEKTLSEAVIVDASSPPSHDPVCMSTPGSKSISNRALVLAALGDGTCRLKNLLHSDDTQVMMAALQDLKGAKFEWEDGGETLVVHGGRGSLRVPDGGKEVYLGNAGTAARFLTTVCTLVSPSSPNKEESTTITGNARMKQRPIGPLVDSLRTNGSSITYLESQGCLPLKIAPAGLQGGSIELAASVSSQYVSSILLCAPYARTPVSLSLVGGQVISQPYIDMTIAMMRTFGVNVTRREGQDVYDIPQGVYTNPEVYAVESDASSATYPLAVAAITGTTCTIQNIGSSSLQGDAQFAVRILRPMGCTVTQTETETTVKGPGRGQLKGLGEVDMEVMTDAFLTASVLAAVAGGKTKIGGIANQRVKECNRIRAMMDQLAKFGVETSEHEDGLEITGKNVSELKKGASVHCYDDHRVAMAFSVLGTVVEGTVIEEKRCVEKTWPNWWDDLENKIGLKVTGVELSHSSTASSSTSAIPEDAVNNKSVLLIGMRGSGKSFLGQTASSTLSWPVIDADAYLESTLPPPSTTIREFVQSAGWDTFRNAEFAALEEILAKYPTGHILSLGGGIVETPKARGLLKSWIGRGGHVVYVKRRMEEIVEYLGSETARPAYGESIESVFERRKEWFEDCSNYEFHNSVGSSKESLSSERVRATREEVGRFFGHITGQRSNYALIDGERRSYFLSLTFPDLTPALADMEQLSTGADAIELRVDLLQPNTEDYVADQLALLRRSTHLPIVFTIRTKSQGGAFPDDQHDQALKLLKLAIRNAVEYVDVEISLPEAGIKELVASKGRSSKILASWHDWSGAMAWDGADVKAKYAKAAQVGDIVKIIGSASSLSDNFKL